MFTGKRKIAETLASFPPGEFEWKVTGTEVAASGDFGYTWGKYGQVTWGPMLVKTVGRFAPDWQLQEPLKDVDWVIANGCMIGREALVKVGLFDEDFFAYLEDADLAWRAQLAGWRAVYAPMARVTHWHSATSVEGSPFKSHLLGRNKVWLIAKNYPPPQLWYYLPLIVAYDAAAVLYALLKYRDLHALRGRIEDNFFQRAAAARVDWELDRDVT